MGASREMNLFYSLENTRNTHVPHVSWPAGLDAKNEPLVRIRVPHPTSVIAGPTISNILAMLGAAVLRASSQTIPEATMLMFYAQIGKRSTGSRGRSSSGNYSRTRRSLLTGCGRAHGSDSDSVSAWCLRLSAARYGHRTCTREYL